MVPERSLGTVSDTLLGWCLDFMTAALSQGHVQLRRSAFPTNIAKAKRESKRRVPEAICDFSTRGVNIDFQARKWSAKYAFAAASP